MRSDEKPILRLYKYATALSTLTDLLYTTMSLLPLTRYRYDPFFYYDLDYFDYWYDWDLFPRYSRLTPRYRWYKLRDRLVETKTTVSQTKSYEQLPPPPPPPPFRVQLDVNGFSPEKLQKRIEGRQLVVEGKQEDIREERTSTTRQMKETFQLPDNVGKRENIIDLLTNKTYSFIDPSGLTSYTGSNNKLVVEVPYKTNQYNRQLEYSSNTVTNIDDINLQPRVVTKGNNQKQFEVTVDVKGYQAEDVKVSVRNNQLIVEGERQQNDNNRSEKTSFVKSTTLPLGVQTGQLQTRFNSYGELIIEAPIY